jgi:uncharacterized protein RhaS with RHS repeats
MQYNRARYYDAAIGRFLSEDPIGFAGGDSNIYRYVANSPLANTDPLGLDGIPFFGPWYDSVGYDKVDFTPRPDKATPKPELLDGNELIRQLDIELKKLREERDQLKETLEFLEENTDESGFITNRRRPKKPKECR